MDFAERFIKSPPTHWQTAPLPGLPAEEPPLAQVPGALEGIVARAADLVPLLQDGQAFGEHPSEDELIAHFVVPFLRALGWPPERIAVKWRYIDVAVFRALPRTPENCHLVIEAKRLPRLIMSGVPSSSLSSPKSNMRSRNGCVLPCTASEA